ncbi:MAG: hypothetical protein RR758_04225, partial [Burkholderiaceae bacterium]
GLIGCSDRREAGLQRVCSPRPGRAMRQIFHSDPWVHPEEHAKIQAIYRAHGHPARAHRGPRAPITTMSVFIAFCASAPVESNDSKAAAITVMLGFIRFPCSIFFRW